MPRIYGLLLGAIFFAHHGYADFDAEFYHARYGRTDIFSKLVNDHGDGYENLYGVRNFREVLKGALYRGGANNLYHRDPKLRRDNKNPLPIDGLQNLCEEGFRDVIYLYATNFEKAPPRLDCQSVRGNNRMVYEQYGMRKPREILQRVYAAIQNPQQGPIYTHCWNGWHASGFVGAIALKQFCGMSGDAAVAYWIRNTDGTDDGSYEEHKKRIRDFAPYADLQIDSATQARICP